MKKWDNIYNFLMVHMPYWIMYKKIYIDSMHKIWIPCWGWSKKQAEDSKKWAEEIKKT